MSGGVPGMPDVCRVPARGTREVGVSHLPGLHALAGVPGSLTGVTRDRALPAVRRDRGTLRVVHGVPTLPLVTVCRDCGLPMPAVVAVSHRTAIADACTVRVCEPVL